MAAALSGTGESSQVSAVRQACRLAALESELRMLGELSSEHSLGAVQAHVGSATGGSGPHAIVRGGRDARFRFPLARLEEALEHFQGELARRSAAGKTLLVVAHPDDEVIGAGAQLARLEDVTVVHVTDGAPRDPEYALRLGFTTPSSYGDARRRESREALRLAGVPEDRQLNLGYPDGELAYDLVELCLSLAELLDEQRPDLVITHPYEGGHTDHDAIAFAVHLACGVLQREGSPVPVVLELTSYHSREGGRVVHDFLPYAGVDMVRTVELDGGAAKLKARMYEQYETQRACLAQFSVNLERFRPAPRYNFTEPPHSGPLEYERRSRRMTGEQWRKQAARALRQLRTRKHGRIATIAPPATQTASVMETAIFAVG